jgi:hypothetical protein
MWRLFQGAIIVTVAVWFQSLPGAQKGGSLAPYLFGLYAAFIATFVLSKLIDLLRWLGRVGSAATSNPSLRDQASSDCARLTAAKLERDELIEQWPRPQIDPLIDLFAATQYVAKGQQGT